MAPAALALVVSLAFTLFAAAYPRAANLAALPVAIVALSLMYCQSRRNRSGA